MIRKAMTIAAALQLACGRGGVDLEREASGIPWADLSGKIAYARWNDPESADGGRGLIFVADVAARTVRLVRNVPIVSEAPSYLPVGWARDLAFNPGGTAIAFAVLNRDSLSWELRSLDLESGSEKVLFPTALAHHNYPSWAPDGRLAYYSNGDDGVNLFVDGQFVLNSPYMSRVAWMGQNSFIGSLEDDSSEAALYLVDFVSRSLAPIATAIPGPAHEIFFAPAVSPDGRRVAYIRGGMPGDGEELWICDIDGQNKARLTHGFFDFDPAWSSDGSRILFARWNSGLHYHDLATGTLKQVTHTPLDSMAWSP